MRKLLMIFLAFGAVTGFAQSSTEYPAITRDIKCLLLNEQGKTLVGKTISLEKILLDVNNSYYNLEVAIDSMADYSATLESLSEGVYVSNQSIMSVKVQISKNSMDNYLNPSKMEPFFLSIDYESSFFNTRYSYKAKCLDRIY